MLPFFNTGTKEYQREMLDKTTSIRDWVELGSDVTVDVLDKQLDVLQTIESILRDNLELNSEWMDSEKEDIIEAKRDRKKVSLQELAKEKGIGSAKPESGSLFGAISSMLSPGGIAAAGGLLRGALAKAAPLAAFGLAAIDAIDIAMAYFDDDLRTEVEGQDVGGVAGSALGAVIGGAIGSVIPGIGTVIGASLGSILGNFVGEKVGDWIAPNLVREFEKSKFETQQQNEALNQQLNKLLELRNSNAITEEEYLRGKANIEAQLSSNERLAKERELADELLKQRDEAQAEYQKALDALREAEAEALKTGLAVPNSLYEALKEAEEGYYKIDAKFKEEAQKMRDFMKTAEEKGILDTGGIFDSVGAFLTGSKIGKIDESKLGEATETELRGMRDSGELDYKSLQAVNNEIRKRAGQAATDPNSPETLMQAYNAAKNAGDRSSMNEIAKYVRSNFNKGALAAIKLQKGEKLTAADLQPLQEKATTATASDTRMLAGMGDTGEFGAEPEGPMSPTPKPAPAPAQAPDAGNQRGGFSSTGEFGGSAAVTSAVVSGASIPTVGGLGGIDYKSYVAAIAAKESGGDYRAVNTLGYVGKYQFGSMALQDAGLVKPGTKQSKASMENPDNWTIEGGLEAFLNDAALQEKTMTEYTKRNYSTLKRIGVISENSSPEQVAGYLATSHLLGPGGAKKFMKGEDGADAYGTTGSTYFAVGTGSQGSGSVGPSSSGSPSGGNAGSSVNSGSKLNAAMSSGGGQPIVVNNNNNIDNSSRSSVSQTTSMPATPNRARSVGTRLDYNDPILGF